MKRLDKESACPEFPVLNRNFHSPEGIPSGVYRGPDDDIILLCTSETEADFLVTGDNDLLVPKEYADTKILCPREFELLLNKNHI